MGKHNKVFSCVWNMSVHQAGLRVLNTSNIFFPCPHLKNGSRISPNPSFTTPWGKFILNASDITGVFVTGCFGCRVVWLYFHWNDYTLAHLSEAVLDFATWCAATIGLCVTPIFRRHSDCFRWLLNQRCFQIEETFQAAPMNAFFLEVFAAGFLLPLVAAFTAPFVVEVSPIQVILGNGIETKLISSALYGRQAAKNLTYFTWYILCMHSIHC